MRKLFFILSVLFSIFILYNMVSLSISRYIFMVATGKNELTYFGNDQDQLSVPGFIKAINFLPVELIPFTNDQDKHDIHAYLGKIYQSMAKQADGQVPSDYTDLLIKAENHYQLSIELNPYDIDVLKGRAEVGFLLEKTGNRSFNALPFFEQLALMTPNDVESHYSIAAYFHYKDFKERLLETVSHLIAIYPADYSRVKTKDFFSPDLKPAIKQGIESAIRNSVNLKQAYFAMGQFYRDEKNYTEAIAYYQKGLSDRTGRNSIHPYLELGRMQLDAGLTEPAIKTFKAVANSFPASDGLIRRIYHIFKTRKKFDTFLTFADRMGHVGVLSGDLGIYIAKARIELGLFGLARARLLQIIADKENPEAYSLLALIGEKEKDWDNMELNIQRATLLSPSNCKYYSIFAKALARQGKKVQAEIQRKKARECINSKKN